MKALVSIPEGRIFNTFFTPDNIRLIESLGNVVWHSGDTKMSESELIEKMSLNPSRILGISKGTLSAGHSADIVIFDPEKEWTVDVNEFHSKSKNSPYDGFKLYGKPEYVIVGGKIVINQGELMK